MMPMEKAKKIVIAVDDETSVYDLFKIHFKREIRANEFELKFFEGAAGCLNFLEKNLSGIKIILILSDINMPEMDGLTMLEIVKKKYPSIPVYVASAYETEEYKSKARELGVNGYLTKPINFDEVRRIIGQETTQVVAP